MRYTGYIELNDHHADYSNVHSDRTALSEQYGANIANNINECNYRYMVTGNDQHCNDGYNDLYIYSGSGTVCCCGDDGYCDHHADHSNVHSDRTALSELNCTVAANNINQCNYRNLVAGND